MTDNSIKTGPFYNMIPTLDSPDKSPGTPPSPSKIPILKLPVESPKDSPKRAAIKGTWPYPDDPSIVRQNRRGSLSATTTGINRRRSHLTASTFLPPENSPSPSRLPPWAESRATAPRRSSLGPKEPDTPTRRAGRRATLPLSSGRISQPKFTAVNEQVPTLAEQVATLEARVASYEGQATELAAVRQERDDLTTRVTSLEADLESARTALAAKEQDAADNTSTSSDATAVNTQVATIAAKVAALEARVAAQDVQNALAVLAAVRKEDDGLADRVSSLETARNALTNRVISLEAIRESGRRALAANEQDDDGAANASVTDTTADTAAKLEAHVYKSNVSLDCLGIIVKGLKQCSDYATECAQRAEDRAIRVEDRAQRAAECAEGCAQRAEEKVDEGERKIGQMGDVVRGLEEVNKELVIAVTKLGENGGEKA